MSQRNFATLVDFSNLINSDLDINFILNNLLLTCFGKFLTSKGFVLLADDNGNTKAGLIKGYNLSVFDEFIGKKIDVAADSFFSADFNTNNKIAIIEKIETTKGTIGIFGLGDKITKESYSNEDIAFIKTLLKISSVAIENSLTLDKLNQINRNLDSKINQLNSLFDLSKEFSSILDDARVNKLLVLTLIGQLAVSRYAIISLRNKQVNIIDSKFPDELIKSEISFEKYGDLKLPLTESELDPNLVKAGVRLIVPMNIKDETKGLILLGKRLTQNQFTKSDIEFIMSVASLAVISIENAYLFKETLEKQKYEKDLEIARNIQRNLLPQKTPKSGKYEIFAYSQSARMVGGDYYDLVKLESKNILVAVADVSGKGVQAALLMANVQAFLKAISKQNIPLNQASNLINDLISDNTSMGSFITFFWGILSESEPQIEYVNAGHNPPLLIRDGVITKLKTGGMILGVMQTVIPYEEEIVKLKKDDVLVLFTDGISEAMDIENQEYSDEKLEEYSLKNYKRSAKEIGEGILSDVKSFTKDAEQSDDITLLVIKVINE